MEQQRRSPRRPSLVGRDGTINETFEDSVWIFHLGLKDTHGRYDKSSVAIEFPNELPLDLDGDCLYAFGMNEAEIDAGIDLTFGICRRHEIEPFSTTSTALQFPAMLSGRDDRLSLQLPRRQGRSLSAKWVYQKIEVARVRLRS